MKVEVTKLTVNSNLIQSKVEALLDTETRRQIQMVFAELIDPWTPFLTGQLHRDLTIDETGVTYNAPYSAEKYYGEVFCKDYHPLATSHWDKVALETEMPVLKARIIEILQARARELYG